MPVSTQLASECSAWLVSALAPTARVSLVTATLMPKLPDGLEALTYACCAQVEPLRVKTYAAPL